MKRNGTTTATGGFSLIEVTIAMAIASLALVTLMGLIPQGMNTMKDAGDQAIMGRVHQQVLSELQMADFDALETFQDMEIYYDSQGEELSDSKDQGSATEERKKGAFDHIYTARISVPKSTGGRMPDSVGGTGFDGVSFEGKSNGSKNALIRPVVIEIAAVSGLASGFDWKEEKYRKMIHTYQSSVVKMGQSFTR